MFDQGADHFDFQSSGTFLDDNFRSIDSQNSSISMADTGLGFEREIESHSTLDQINAPHNFPENFCKTSATVVEFGEANKQSSKHSSQKRRFSSIKTRIRGVTRRKIKRAVEGAGSVPRSKDKFSEERIENQIRQPQEVIAILEDFVQNCSITKKKASELVEKFKELVKIERDYWSSNIDSSTTSTSLTTQDGLSISEIMDSDLTSETSFSSSSAYDPQGSDLTGSDTSSVDLITSTPRQPAYQLSVAETNFSRQPRPSSRTETLYYCTFKGCAFTVSDFSDWKRHEETLKHWPQQRFMCTECPTTIPDMHGNPSCGFCRVPLAQLGVTSPNIHYLQCADALRLARSFQKHGQLLAHLRDDHHWTQADAKQGASSSKYGVSSQWPRQCGFCGDNFQSWDERMDHIGKHFTEEGLDKSAWKLPSRRPKDSHPKKPDFQRKYDEGDDSDDDDFNDNRGPAPKRVARMVNLPSGSQKKSQNQSSEMIQSNGYQGSYSQMRNIEKNQLSTGQNIIRRTRRRYNRFSVHPNTASTESGSENSKRSDCRLTNQEAMFEALRVTNFRELEFCHLPPSFSPQSLMLERYVQDFEEFTPAIKKYHKPQDDTEARAEVWRQHSLQIRDLYTHDNSVISFLVQSSAEMKFRASLLDNMRTSYSALLIKAAELDFEDTTLVRNSIQNPEVIDIIIGADFSKFLSSFIESLG